ncbi:TIGR03013 family XrtA/PEP-CTERM system glycosyltransferase [Magnetospira sp. QH-2]|uniref:TIGR03013 family XrtA/PEP-CTERM system glycosyltransferase n=1 Tax=Magnetospira sp. (strain QH-2) TaxID=1288970 RepID=UPI002737AC32|nr:TIGR03013 family XrtA/PEP-CTERM system glycosyltransferase [Magnetospira sp. QH-2]
MAMLEAGTFYLFLVAAEMAQSWYWSQKISFEPKQPVMILVLAFVAFLVMAGMGLYNRQIFADIRTSAKHALMAFPLIYVAMSLYIFIHSRFVEMDAPPYYTICILALPVAFGVIFGVRALAIEVLDLKVLKRRVLVLGTGRLAIRIARLVQKSARHHFSVAGFIHMGEEIGEDPPPAVNPVLPLEMVQERGALKKYVLHNGIDEIVFASRERRRQRGNAAFGLPVWELLECKIAGAQVTDYPSFWEREAGELDLDELQPGWLLSSEGFRIAPARKVVKRLFDVIVSFLILFFSLPLSLPAAILVKLTSPGPVFYRQERVGLDGKPFDVLKLRSMRNDAEKNGPQFAQKGDPRVTPVGRFIRLTRIDEIPQVLNVLKGDMSFIGPRPERPYFVDTLCENIPFYSERHAVKPGISGWAQINYPYGDSLDDAKRKLAFDLYYVKNGSTFLDILILLQTARVVLFPSGAGAR